MHLGDALSVRELLEKGAVICALHEAGEHRELYFEDVEAARIFAGQRRVEFEWPEKQREPHAVDFLSQGNMHDYGHAILYSR